VTFSFDARSHSTQTLARVEQELLDHAARISVRRGVHFAFDPMTGDLPALMDPELHRHLLDCAQRLDIPVMAIASGAGHDAGDFAAAGIPSAMIFIRNDKGSHNPEEAMEAEDFALGVGLLAAFIADYDSSDA
jgi:N-carbamoyl-L-amino-acid hydrolase